MRKTTVFVSLRLSLKMRNGVLKEEVNESQKEGVEGEKQRQEMGGCMSKSDSHDCVKQHSWSSSISHQ